MKFDCIVAGVDRSTLNETLTATAFYVLLARTDRVLHGYRVREQVALDSEGGLVPAMGTVYPLLERLVKSRCVERIDVGTAKSRIVCRYRITALGRKRLEGEIRRMERGGNSGTV